MKKLIVLVGLIFSLQVLATPLEPAWKSKLRDLITKVAGEEWSTRLLGAAPKEEEPTLAMPQIPKLEKKSTDTGTYDKKVKEPTEFDKLPPAKKKQFDYKFLEELFLVTRKTEAKDEDLANWLNTLDQGGSREGIYQALVLDEVYAALEGMEEKPSKRLLDFSMKFSQKYLNQTFKEESLSGLNLYSLKRILTEKGLDLLEHFETADHDALYRWYANFSAELAAEHAQLLKSQIRQATSPIYHYEWAKSMPIQHIKSEFIIKIHTVMNGLQLIQE